MAEKPRAEDCGKRSRARRAAEQAEADRLTAENAGIVTLREDQFMLVIRGPDGLEMVLRRWPGLTPVLSVNGSVDVCTEQGSRVQSFSSVKVRA